MLTKFNNEVLRYGPAAVLPQNLSDEWLTVLQEKADNFLDANFDLDECRDPQSAADPLLTACVSEIILYQQKGDINLTAEEMLRKITVYALRMTMETVHRDASIELEPPTLETVLEWEGILDHRHHNPEFIEVLEQACILKAKERNWLKTIKDKLFTADAKQ